MEESPVVSPVHKFEITKKKHLSLKKSLGYAKRIISLGKPYHNFLYVALISIFIQTFFELLAPVYIGKAIDCIVGAGNVNFNGVITNSLIVIGCTLINVLFTYLGNFFTNKYCFKSAQHIRKLMFKKFNKVPLKFVDGNQHGDLLSRMINDVELMTDGFLEGLSSVTNGAVTIIGTLIFMFVLNVPLALVVLVLTPLSLLISAFIAKKSFKLFAAQAKTEGEINGYLEEMISGDKLVTAFNYQDDAIEQMEEINHKYYKVAEKAEFYSSLSNPATRFINGLVYIMVAFVGAMLKIRYDLISVGLISSFLSYANSFGKPFSELSTEFTELQAALASCERIFTVLDAKDEPSDKDLTELASTDGNVEIKDVNFSYSPKQKLIENFNLKVQPGQTIAIVGPTGCGKTTLINLLMRFYDVTSGAILVDDNDITKITRRSLRNKYGMVLQETWIFAGTIRENIAYGKPNATDEEIKEAARLAGADDFINKLTYGYATKITEGGGNLSAGQKQLLCIARVMLIKPPMLILDEATSNIDTRTEMKIQNAFNTLMTGRTTFIVAHRLSTIKTADKILVMNKGNVIEQGTHKELLKLKGFYYELYNSQFSKI
ncbi:MAG: ABC transporter ATP-binding protein [Clostridiales bacterium]|nr:ABC transporter ATP-binding protein [Clostridiales bacterium]